ncbi:MAG: hypothetical protein V3U72_03825 [Candidatus Aenigmarchaeota archaeon]
MARLGFFQFLFPFLLALAIVYGLLRWALPEQLPKSATAVISLIIAFFVMFFSSWNIMVVNFFTNIAGEFLVVAVGLLFIVMLLAITGQRPQELLADTKAKWIVVLLVVFIGILIFFGAGAAWLINVPGFAIGSDFWTILFFIVILAIVLYWLGREEGGGAAAPAAGGEESKT